ncbi:MAG: 4Fe-4S dicluster domain-containing protein, partial [bacterium]
QRTTLGGIGAHRPDVLDFSVSAGSGPFDEDGLDMLFYDMDKEFYVKVLTEKGKKLLDDNFSTPEEHHRKLAQEIKQKAEGKAHYNLNMERWKKYDPLEIFQLPYWSEVYLPCIECGACTFVCPTTIYSRMVDVEAEGGAGRRVRVWDSPYLERFAMTTEGYNPRPTLKDRFRDWVLEKFLFFPLETGMLNCVGCGRCILHCPTQIDFRKIIANVRFE